MLLRVNQQGQPVGCISTCTNPRLGTAVFKRAQEKIATCFLHSFYCFSRSLLSMILVGLWSPRRFFFSGLGNCHFLDIYWWKFCDSCSFCWGCRLSFYLSLRCFGFSSYCLTKGSKSILTVFLSLALTAGLLFFTFAVFHRRMSKYSHGVTIICCKVNHTSVACYWLVLFYQQLVLTM